MENKIHIYNVKHQLVPSFFGPTKAVRRNRITVIAVILILLLLAPLAKDSSPTAKSSLLLPGEFMDYHTRAEIDHFLFCTDAELLGIIWVPLCLPSSQHFFSVITESLLVHKTLSSPSTAQSCTRLICLISMVFFCKMENADSLLVHTSEL